MAEEVEMTPVTAAEPPKVNPLATAAAPKAPAVASGPAVRPPTVGGATALKPGLKLPPQSGLKPGLKLPPKPGATVSAVRPGLKLPTQNALKPGIKLPPKPVIRKPGTGVSVAPLPKPVAPAAAAKPAEATATPAKPAAPVAPAPVAKPVAVDVQGVGKLPTVAAKAVARDAVAPVAMKPMEALKSVTQKLKGVTQEIPQQAILHKTGIIAESAMTDAQKEAAKHKTARISLSDAMGVAPVKNESAPMKTIRIKRPISIPGATTPLKPQPPVAPAAEAAPATVVAAAPAAETAVAEAEPSASITQRKTLKIARPGAVRPAGKFGIKRPSQATAVTKPAPAADGAAGAAPAPAADGAVADIADIPSLPTAFPPEAPTTASASDGPAWLWTLSSLVQIAACVAMGALAWFLYQNTQISYF